MGEFYGRNMPAPPARVDERRVRAARAALRDATRRCATRDGEQFTSRARGRRSTSCSGPPASRARAPGTRSPDAHRASAVRERTVGEHDRRRASAPARRRAPRRDDDGRGRGRHHHDARRACASTPTRASPTACSPRGADAGGIATGGYASGLAAALVFGRIAAERRSAVGSDGRGARLRQHPSRSPSVSRRSCCSSTRRRHALAHGSERVLAALELPERARGARGATPSELELRSPVCRDAGEAARAVAGAAGGRAARRRAPR